MRATENAVEALARDSSGTNLVLDEMAHADGKVIGRMIYSLAGDVGKARMRPDSSLRRSYTWSTFGLLSGEKSLEQKVRGDGGQWTGGMAVRFPDIDVTGVNPCVAPETIDAVKQIFVHYGHAGPAFIRALVANGLHREPDLLKERIKATARKLAGVDADSARIRAAIPFAFVAIGGALAQQFGILPSEADVSAAVRWAWERFCSSSDALALDPDLQAVISIRQYIAERWDVTIKNVTDGKGVNNREAVGWYDQDTVYLPTNRITEAAGGALKEQRTAAVLDKGGTCLAAAVQSGSRSDMCPEWATSTATRCGGASSAEPTRTPIQTSFAWWPAMTDASAILASLDRFIGQFAHHGELMSGHRVATQDGPMATSNTLTNQVANHSYHSGHPKQETFTEADHERCNSPPVLPKVRARVSRVKSLLEVVKVVRVASPIKINGLLVAIGKTPMATVVSLFQINRLPAAWLALAVTVAMIPSCLPILFNSGSAWWRDQYEERCSTS